MTSSPGPMFKALRDSLIASVPELTPIAYLVPINLAKLSSNLVKGSPKVKSPVVSEVVLFPKVSFMVAPAIGLSSSSTTFPLVL